MNLLKSAAKAFKQMSMLGLMRVMAEERSVNELVTSTTGGPAPNDLVSPDRGYAVDGDWGSIVFTTKNTIYD